MALLKRLSYIRDTGNKSKLDWELYLLKAIPLSPSETKKDRDRKILDLINNGKVYQM